MATAFQRDAFQNNAFQIDEVAVVTPQPVRIGGPLPPRIIIQNANARGVLFEVRVFISDEGHASGSVKALANMLTRSASVDAGSATGNAAAHGVRMKLRSMRTTEGHAKALDADNEFFLLGD